MMEISVSTCCLVVHPETKQVCAAKEVRGGLRLTMGRDGKPVQVEVLLSPLDNDTLDFDTFRLAVEEVQRAPQDLRWSFKTAVRSYLKNAAIYPQMCVGRDRKRQLAVKINEKWRQRPVCSTVPPRVWQKYLLKLCQRQRSAMPRENAAGAPMERGSGPGEHLLYCGRSLADAARAEATLSMCGRSCGLSRQGSRRNLSRQSSREGLLPSGVCGPDEGPQCEDCLRCQWAWPSDDPDSEVAWVDDILRLMPVKDDRVLPRELAEVLLDTRLWQHLDFLRGPPPHRRGDLAPVEATVYNREWLHAFKRTPLPPGMRNFEGAPVQLGRNSFTVYCGRQVAKPQQLTARLGQQIGEPNDVYQWDGRCGPVEGPQCAACRRLEDRLLA